MEERALGKEPIHTSSFELLHTSCSQQLREEKKELWIILALIIDQIFNVKYRN
jgi:hypothetical protein